MNLPMGVGFFSLTTSGFELCCKDYLYEQEADKISYALKKQIFAAQLDKATKIHLREFVDQIDAIADKAEDVADRLTIYAIKRQN